MDPRPYHYQYRKPRFSNPTYESNRMYSSIYQPNSYLNDYLTSQRQSKSLNKNIKYQLPPINHDTRERSAEKIYYNGINNDDLLYKNASSIVEPTYQKNVKMHDLQYQSGKKIDDYGYPKYEYDSKNEDEKLFQFNNEKHEDLYMNGVQKPNIRIKNSRANNSYRKYKIDNPETLTNEQDQKQPISQIPIKSRKVYQNNYPHESRPNEPQTISYNHYLSESKKQYQDPYLVKYHSRQLNEGSEQNISRQRKRMGGSSSSQQDYVYNKQMKPYDIITCNPTRGITDNLHRIHPRLTLEDRLIEKGNYYPERNIYRSQN